MIKEPIKIRVSKGKIKVLNGEIPDLQSESLIGVAKDLSKVYRNILIEIHHQGSEEIYARLVEKALRFLDLGACSDLLNDAYMILEGNKHSPDFYLAVLGRKVTVVTYAEYLQENQEALNLLLCNLLKVLDFGESFTLKLVKGINLGKLAEVFSDTKKLVLYELYAGLESPRFIKDILTKYPNIRYLELRKGKKELFRFQKETGLLEMEIESEDKLEAVLNQLEKILDSFDYFETYFLECLPHLVKKLNVLGSLSGLSLYPEGNKLAIELMKKGYKKKVYIDACEEIANLEF